MGSKAKSFDGLTALLGRTGECRYRLAKGVGEEEHKREEERRVEEQKKVEEEEEEEERKRKALKEEDEKKKREEKEERLGRRKGQGKFPGLSVSRLLKITPFKKIVADKNLYFDIYPPLLPTHNDTGIIITNAINKIFTMTEIMSRSQILRRHTTYDKGKAVHIHSWHRQVAISINNNINIAIIIMYHIMATKIWALLT